MAKKARRAPWKAWTRADIAALKKYSKQRLPVARIAKLMKRTVATLRTKAFSLGLSLGHTKRRKRR